MNWLWRLVDSRNHIEGKIVAVITAFVLAFTLFGSYGPVSAFAGGGFTR